MRQNRKRPKTMSVVAERSMHVAAVIVMLFGMVILNLMASSSCTQLMNSIGEKEKMLAKLEETRERENVKWEEMITPDRLERHLVKHGLSMHYPKAAQTVRMRTDGTPYPGQLSLLKADARVNSRNVAMAGTRREIAVPSVSARSAKRSAAAPASRKRTVSKGR